MNPDVPPPDKFSLGDRIRSFHAALKGIWHAFQNEHNLWVQSSLLLGAIIAGVWLRISAGEWVLVVLASGLVLSAELINTALEELVNWLSPAKNEHARRIKDVAAAAVLLAAVSAALAGGIIFIPKVIALLR